MILILGGIDVSDYVSEGYRVDISPVYDSSTSFENMLGQNMENLIGNKYSLSCTLPGLDKKTAAAVCRVCRTDALEVTFAYPLEKTLTFKNPSLTSVLVTETPEEWEINLSMETDTVPIDGL